MTRNILIPVDGSDNSERAFNFYLEEIRKADDHLLLVHIQPAPHLPSFSLRQPLSLPNEEWANLIKDQVTKSQKILEHYEIICEQKKISKTPLLESGTPGEHIVELSAKHNVNMIVIGSRGLNAVRRTFTGSVSDYVMHHSNIPVLVVPPSV